MTTKPVIGNFSSVGDAAWTKSDGTSIGSVNGSTGAWVFGPTGGNVSHLVNGREAVVGTDGGENLRFQFLNAAGANKAALLIGGFSPSANNAYAWIGSYENGVGAAAMKFASYTTEVGGYSKTGRWTIGPSGFTEYHTVNGKLDVTNSPDTEGLFVKNTNGSYTSRVLLVNSERTSSTAYQLISAFSGVFGFTALEQFSVRGDGQIFARFNSISLLSDQRFKENIQPIPSTLDKICDLKPVSWDWIDKNQPGENEGFVAQDLDLIFPDLVDKTKHDEWHANVNGGKMIARMVKAIQELKAELDTAKARITELEGV
jgi:hypothetical protein